ARCLKKGIVGRHARTWNNQVLRKKCFLRVPAEFKRHARFAQLCGSIAELAFPACFRGRDNRVVFGAEECRGHTRSRESHDQHAHFPQLHRSRHVVNHTTFQGTSFTAISASSKQTARTPAPQSRSARSPCSRSNPAVQNGDGWAPCERFACRAIFM